MEPLATRVLTYLDDRGIARDLLLTLFLPSPSERGPWKGGFSFGEPIATIAETVMGVDCIQVLVSSLQIARGHLQGTHLRGHVQWRGKADCGLPWHHKAPAHATEPALPEQERVDSDCHILATRDLGYCDEKNVERKVVLTLFMPVEEDNGSWKCGAMLDAGDNTQHPKAYFGRGYDAIEAILDALSMARASFSHIAANSPELPDSSDLLDCTGFPRKLDGAFCLDPAPSRPPFPPS